MNVLRLELQYLDPPLPEGVLSLGRRLCSCGDPGKNFLDARQNLAQLGNGLRRAGGAQRKMQQSQAGDRSWIHRSFPHLSNVKGDANLPHSFCFECA
jgi:hypothetical protein